VTEPNEPGPPAPDASSARLAQAAAARLARVEGGRHLRLRPAGGARQAREYRFYRIENGEVVVTDLDAVALRRIPLEEVARRGELARRSTLRYAAAGFLLPGIACGVLGQQLNAITSGDRGGVAIDWLVLGGIPGLIVGALIGWSRRRWEPLVPPADVARMTGREEDVPEQFRG
jgi:hypothetical protein